MMISERPHINSGQFPGWLLVVNVVIALGYFSWWLTSGQTGHPVLFTLLFMGEIYHLVMVGLFWFTVKHLQKTSPTLPTFNSTFQPEVDVFVTVAGEPIRVVKHTIQSILETTYPAKNIYILNDSYVAHKSNWQAYESLAQEFGVHCLTRKRKGGAKAGNINHALRQTQGELIAIFDADMAPLPDFFDKTVPFFEDENMGFVQSPQFYQNESENAITTAAWQQQEFFFGPIMRGKNTRNAAFICGTNVVIRRQALVEVGGMNETNIAEDFLTSLYIHKSGWKSHYVPEVLAMGLAPQDLLSYYKQQLRWARGSIEVLFRHNPLVMKGLSWPQKFEYLSSALYYLNGLIVAIDMIIPLIFLFTGITPIQSSTSVFALFFLPFMMSVIYSLHRISGRSLTLNAIAFTQASWYLQLQAIWYSLTNRELQFSVTPKQAQSGNYLFLTTPHLGYITLALIGTAIAVHREGISPAVITNLSWVSFNILLFIPFIWAALPKVSWQESSDIHQVKSSVETAPYVVK